MINNKQIYRLTAAVAVILFFITSCKVSEPSDLGTTSIIPKPVSVTATGDWYNLDQKTTIYYQGDSEELKLLGQYLADRINPATGFGTEVKQATGVTEKGAIYLSLATDGRIKEGEGYLLEITEENIRLTAATTAGIFMGIQTLRQIFPSEIEMPSVQTSEWKLATGTITDYPDYSYRGAMLDVARHFFGVDDVKRFIDLISYYKINHLHLHLSDDQGWRIEIKSWPDLAIHGGSTQVGGGAGGYYTQEQYSDIVKYAQSRYITIVPEIDMPGHTNAALASYAELNCNGKATELYTGTRVGFSTLCAKKEVTYKFVDDVVKEIAALTPGQYFHIGGDESHATKKEDYKLFIEKVQEIVKSHGKTVLGWDEIATTTLTEGAVAQYWAEKENALAAVDQGSKVLMSPADRAYLDMQYDSTTHLGLHWAAYIEVDDAYNWDPATLVPGIKRENILGIEAPLWSETVTKMDDIEYMVFPRLSGIAEIGWTAPALRDWESYKLRLASHGKRLEAMGVDFYRSKLIPW